MFTRGLEAAADSTNEAAVPPVAGRPPSRTWSSHSFSDGAFARMFRDKGRGAAATGDGSAAAKRWSKLFNFNRKDRYSARFTANDTSSLPDGLNAAVGNPLSKDALTEEQKTRLAKVVVTIYGNRSLAYAKNNEYVAVQLLALDVGCFQMKRRRPASISLLNPAVNASSESSLTRFFLAHIYCSARSALTDADKVLDLDPSWTRGYHRKAAALKLNGQMQEAINTLDKGLELDSNNRGLTELREELRGDLRNST